MNATNKEIILIIDDDNRNIFALEQTLKAKGFLYLSSQTAAEGLKTLSENRSIALVLMDMMMPEMDGYEAIRIIRSSDHNPDIPIIAVTAQAMSGDREKCIEAGASAYVSKPIDVDSLIAIIKELMP